jgi:WXXGXW repeat (2 copies)
MRKFLLNAFMGAAMCAGLAHAEVVVQVSPPRAIVEHRVVRPSRDHVWIGGYHRWDGRAYVWEPGRWELPPRPHAVWVAPRWTHRHDGYVFVEGRWR